MIWVFACIACHSHATPGINGILTAVYPTQRLDGACTLCWMRTHRQTPVGPVS